jgi:ADP-ribose pyrophosphatase
VSDDTQPQSDGQAADLTETTIQSTSIYAGAILSLRKDEIQMPNGRLTVREIVDHADSVCMVPLDDAGNVVLVRQYRKAVEAALLEVPAGGIEAGEAPEEAAIRELQEEIGHTAGKLQRLPGFYLAPGWCNEYMYAYLATELTAARLDQDYDEIVETRRVPLRETLELIERGEIRDAKSVASLLLAMRVVGNDGSVG